MKKESDSVKSDHLAILKKPTRVLLHGVHPPQKNVRVEEVTGRLHLAHDLHLTGKVKAEVRVRKRN